MPIVPPVSSPSSSQEPHVSPLHLHSKSPTNNTVPHRTELQQSKLRELPAGSMSSPPDQ
uniref:Uncharacterized protein n=1 Tax=Arundo donax TaxID=35708 RepID=A0A0A9BN83_ARUDO